MRPTLRLLSLAAALASLVAPLIPPGDARAAHGAGPTAAPAPAAEPATSLLSKGGAFRVSYRSAPAPVPLNSLHTWTLTVATPAGEPVKGAEIGVEAAMPAHGHGMPTKPVVTKSFPDGTYLVEGLKFSMPGLWSVTFTIRAGAASDVATFYLQLE